MLRQLSEAAMPDDAGGCYSLLPRWPFMKSSLIYLIHFPEAAKNYPEMNLGQRRDRSAGKVKLTSPSVCGSCPRHVQRHGFVPFALFVD